MTDDEFRDRASFVGALAVACGLLLAAPWLLMWAFLR